MKRARVDLSVIIALFRYTSNCRLAESGFAASDLYQWSRLALKSSG
jgi:hypothetical protein